MYTPVEDQLYRLLDRFSAVHGQHLVSKGKITTSRPSREGIILLLFIDHYVTERGRPPTQEEMAAALGLSRHRVQRLLHHLEEQAFIDRDPGLSRAVQINKQVRTILTDATLQSEYSKGLINRSSSHIAQTNKQAKTIQADAMAYSESALMGGGAGRILTIPVNNLSSSESALLVESSKTDYQQGKFIELSQAILSVKPVDIIAYQIRDDGLTDALVVNGDIIVIQLVMEARNGELVAVWLGNRIALKYLYYEGSRFRLQPVDPVVNPKTWTGR